MRRRWNEDDAFCFWASDVCISAFIDPPEESFITAKPAMIGFHAVAILAEVSRSERLPFVFKADRSKRNLGIAHRRPWIGIGGTIVRVISA